MSRKDETACFLFDYTSTAEFNDASASRKYDSVFSFNRSTHSYQSNAEGNECKETAFSKCLRSIVGCLCYMIVICTFPISFPLCIRKVPALERILIFRLGRMEKVKGPGYVLILPCVDRWIKVDLHAQLFRTPKQQLLTCDGAILEVEAVIRYQVVDVIRSVMQVDGLDTVFKNLVQQCVSTAITQRDEEDITRHTDILQMDIQNMLNKSTISWGLEVIQVDIPPVQVLRAAEPRSAVSTLMTALNSAMGGNTQTDSVPTSVVIQSSSSDLKPESNIADLDQAFCRLSEMVQASMSRGTFQGQKGVIRLEITDSKRNFYLTIKDDVGDLYEDLVGTGQAPADVTLHMPSEVLLQLLRKRLTPLHAFSNGLVTMDGDFTLLKNFAEIVTRQ